MKLRFFTQPCYPAERAAQKKWLSAMAGCSQKMSTSNRWAREALISNEVPDAEVDSILKDFDEINYVACITFYRLFKNEDPLPKDNINEIIEMIKTEYVVFLEEELENEALYSTPGEIITI